MLIFSSLPAQRAHALFELGQDYMRAGLFDRAETLFGELVDSNPHSEQALDYLLDIYQQEKDWDKAIQTAQTIELKTGKNLNQLIDMLLLLKLPLEAYKLKMKKLLLQIQITRIL